MVVADRWRAKLAPRWLRLRPLHARQHWRLWAVARDDVLPAPNGVRRVGVQVVLMVCLLSAAAADDADNLRRLLIERRDGVSVSFSVEVAATAQARRRGLMGRTELAPRHGMLFDFGAPTIATMWMKDTAVSLDMLFLDQHGEIVELQARTTPNSLAFITVPRPVRYVLEINAGEAQVLGIAKGDHARLP